MDIGAGRGTLCYGFSVVGLRNHQPEQLLSANCCAVCAVARRNWKSVRPRNTPSIKPTTTATLVMRIVIVIGVVFIFLKVEQTAPRWLNDSDMNPLPSAFN